MDRPGRRQSPVSTRSVGRPSIRIPRTEQGVRAHLCAASAAAGCALEGARRHASACRRAVVLAAIDAAPGATTWDIEVAPGARLSRRRR
jgi:hypothetical protein